MSKITDKDDKLTVEGVVTESLSGGKFRVELDNWHESIGYIRGKSPKIEKIHADKA